ncbi:LacI family DNA-binding transcriptional regulator [Microlunatus sp. GCM10028923]|uniref:LacI family DNA-binding transcriptional regulator n=1 Tax=Microlunatus sp. GCM10028923 TaxID=3273400 RepID=UPI00360DD918
MTATVRDIARLAKVSPATVSRALSRPDTVAEATRHRVLQVADELGYQRQPSRPAERPEQTGAIGIVLPDLDNPTFASLLKSAQHRLQVRGYGVYVADSDRNAEAETELARSLAPRVDGLIICSPLGDPQTNLELGAEVPLLLVDGQVEGLSSVNIEYADGMRQAVTHLAALGHRRIAYAGGRIVTWSEAQRRVGLEQAIAEHALPDLIDLGHFFAGVGGGYAAADQLLATDATAIICVNTFVAMGIVNRLAQRGGRVPDDLSIVEFDAANTNHLVTPMLTTVAPSYGSVGWAAADAIVQLIGTEGSAIGRTVPVELSVQQSTSAPPTRP